MRINNYIKLSEKYDEELLDEYDPTFCVVATFLGGSKSLKFKDKDIDKLLSEVYTKAKGRFVVSGDDEVYFTDARDVQAFVTKLAEFSNKSEEYKLEWIRIYSSEDDSKVLLEVVPWESDDLDKKLKRIPKLKA